MQKIKFYLILLAVLLLLGLGALAYVINSFAPDKTSTILLGYSLAALIGFSFSTLLGFFIRRLFGQREFLNIYIGSASRQGLWFALILTVSLILAHENLFSWLNAALLVLTFVFFESYLLTRNNDKNNQL